MKFFFQKNSEKEEKFKFYVNVKKKVFKRAVDRNKIKRRTKSIMKEVIFIKNQKLSEDARFLYKKKIIVLYDFEIEDLKLKFDHFKQKILQLFNRL